METKQFSGQNQSNIPYTLLTSNQNVITKFEYRKVTTEILNGTMKLRIKLNEAK